MLPNLYNDAFFLAKVKDGTITITPSGEVFNNVTGNKLGTKPTNAGYYQIGMRDSNGRVRHILIHRLVVLVYNRKMVRGEIVNHKNGRKTINRKKNLEIVNYSENAQHAWDTGLSSRENLAEALLGKYMGHRHVMSKLTKLEAKTIRTLYRKGWTQRELADKFGVGKTTVQSIVSRKSYKF